MSGLVDFESRQAEPVWALRDDPIVIGKDIMELLSSSMYVDAMSIYREYIQNSADAIDCARASGVLSSDEVGKVTIDINPAARSVRIRDNGSGVGAQKFFERLTAFGASNKRGSGARGFRGVGRLAGIGYCQQLIFRSRAVGEKWIQELRWDCRKLKSILRSDDFKGNLEDLVHETVSTRSLVEPSAPEHFFEVELHGVIRHKNDLLLDSHAIRHYLAQVAPVPFSPGFQYGDEILSGLSAHVALGNLHIAVTGFDEPIYRPHQNELEIRAGLVDEFTQLEFIQIPNSENRAAVVGWILHHHYLGAIPPRAGVGGLRFRSGNIQIGGSGILEDVFPEPRFNAWTVGELHVIDSQIVPNGRRDHFEQNVHFHNVINHLGPVGRSLTNRARTSSIRRKCLRDLELQKSAAQEYLSIIRQGSLPKLEREKTAQSIRRCIDMMQNLASRMVLVEPERRSAEHDVRRLEAELQKVLNTTAVSAALSKLSKGKREIYQSIFAMIYECAPSQAVGKTIIDRILRRIR